MHLGSFNAVFLSLFIIISGLQSYAELIIALPGQPGNVSFNQYSGYITTDAEHGRALFYYFVEADSVDPLTRPLTLWLNGGPMCSSLGVGAFMEHGPFQPGENGLLTNNKYSWNLESNMLYVESPVGVGFSYSNTSSDYNQLNDYHTAEDNLRFLVNWLEEFPRYKYSDLYLTGESYAGHYIPQLAALIVAYNKMPNVTPFKLKAIALGNPLLDLDISLDSGVYLWSHGAISDETLFLKSTVCNDSTLLREEIFKGKLSEGCNETKQRIVNEFPAGTFIDDGNLLATRCLHLNDAEQLKVLGEHANIHAKRENAGDPCLEDRISAYFNRRDVQKALHANTTGLPYVWNFCNGGTFKYHQEDFDKNIIPVLSALIKNGVPLTLFSGDQDTKIPLTQTRIIANILANDLKLISSTNYGPWFDKNQVGGWAQSFSGVKDAKNVTYLTYATVRGAAHQVPITSPSQALTCSNPFLLDLHYLRSRKLINKSKPRSRKLINKF